MSKSSSSAAAAPPPAPPASSPTEFPELEKVEALSLRKYMSFCRDKGVTNRPWKCPLDGTKGTHLHRMIHHVEKHHVDNNLQPEGMRAVWKKMLTLELEANPKQAKPRTRQASVVASAVAAAKAKSAKKQKMSESAPPPPPAESLQALESEATKAVATYLTSEHVPKGTPENSSLLALLDSFLKIGRDAQAVGVTVTAKDLLKGKKAGKS